MTREHAQVETPIGMFRATVVDACTNRYHVIVAEEGVFDRHEAPHAMNLFDMNQKYADVLGVEEIVGMLRAWQDGQTEAEQTVAVQA